MKRAVGLLTLLGVALVARTSHAVCVGGTADGVVALTEDCDDGNTVDTDGCSNQCTIVGEASCARALSFANLDIENFAGSTASWDVAADNLSGVQTVNNSNPSVALFGEDATRGSYVVRLEVLAPLTFNDDDFIGLALGFDPGDQNNPNADYLVIDWKQAAQNGVGPGMRLAHIRGNPNTGTHVLHAIPQRTCANPTTSCATQLATARTLGTTGWQDQTPVEAVVTYRRDRLELRIDNVLQLDLRPSDFPGEFTGNLFPAGQIGFYLLSQENVEYTNLAPSGASVCNLTSLVPATLLRPIGSANAVIATSTQLVDAGDQLDPASVVVKAVTGGTATVAANGNVTFTLTNPNIAGTYPVTVFACDDDAVIQDCDEAVFTVIYAPDRDGDGVLDPVDLDDDDDGIPDRLENTLGIDPDGDADGDGIPNSRDKTDRGDGQPGSCTDTAAPLGVCDAPGIEFDRDRDGVPNHLDLDSDNDGLLDVVEVFAGLPDANRNGRLDCAGGVGSNGLCNAFEVAPDNGVIDWSGDDVGPDTALDGDGDGLPDFLDLDADGDGLPDLFEGNTGCADTTPADGRCDGGDGDGDGVVNSRDSVAGLGVGSYADRPDTDGDGTPDFRERDADGDTLDDLVEASSGCVDADANGRCDGPDTNGDGLADDAAPTRPDTDGDGRPDFRDLDSDGDGVRDGVEGTGDTDGDGRPDFRDLDSDNDGIPDVVEGASGCADIAVRDGRCDGADANNDGLSDTAVNATPPDTDGDGAVDFRDLDSDNDGIGDVVEGGSGCTDAAPANSVCDGPDANNDGRVDSAALVTTPDGDGDGTADFRDLDSDDDGLPDVGEGGSGCTDADGNAVCDGPDGDGDGIADSIDTAGFGDTTPTVPTNTDGTDAPDFRDLDRDDDGTPDVAISGCTDSAPANQRCDGADTDGDGVVDQADGFDGFGILQDTDGDGVGDAVDLDDDNDGLPDSVEAGRDTDGDGIDDSVDLDSDNDGLPDVVEAGHAAADADHDGTVDCGGGVGANGLCDALETSPDSGVPGFTATDTDGDGLADFRDLDSDDDGIGDRAENGAACADDPVNGVCDGDDLDRDGVVASADGTGGFGVGGYADPPDTDDDGTPDYRDLDADGDGIADVDEAGLGDDDTDDDGRIDGADSDGDGIRDRADADPHFGGAGGGLDTDGDGTPDQRDLDADGDTVPDRDEAGADPANPADTDGDGHPDFQDPDSDDDAVVDGTDNCRLDTNPDQLDSDDDGLGDACDPDDNNDGVPDGFGVQGGGCASSGGDTGIALVVALALLVIRRRRLAVAVAALAVGIPAAHAQQVSTAYPAERFQLTGHRDGILGVEWGDVDGHLVVDVGLWLGYADDPVNVYRIADGERIASFVSRRVGGDLVVALRLIDRVELQLGAPVILAQAEDLGALMATGSLTGFGLGDLRVGAKVALLKQRGGRPFALSLMAGATLPTSTTDDYGGDGGATLAPELIVSRGKSTGLRANLAVGYRIREQTRVLDLIVDDEVFGGLGVGYRWPSSFGIESSLDVATAANDLGGAFNRNFAELRAGAGYDVARAVRLFGATGVGVAEGFGTPDWRALIGVRLDPRARAGRPRVLADPDRDGLVGAADRCPELAETVNQFQDDDGCPDDPDADHDGVIGDADRCPAQAEDVDGWQDADGCPEPDNDGDGVLDVADRCREVPGSADNQGCPDPDRDGDGLVDRKDACPDAKGLPALEGCPDRDSDTIADAKDNCPDEPGPPENQGCKAKQLVRITGSKLEILDIVYFALDKAIIQPRSYRVLDDVAKVLAAHPEISHVRVEGHTDDQGNDAYNKKLSQRRADAVVAYLVGKGVAKDRLEGVGYGEEQPKVPNDSKENRAINRRVEFTLLDPPSNVEVRPAPPTP